MNYGIEGRRAAVAAASSGLGLATAKALADEGVTVAICSRSRERIDAAAAEIGPLAVPLVADVVHRGGRGRVRATRRRHALGGVDILVCNGGGPPPGQLHQHAARRVPHRGRAQLPRAHRDVHRRGARDARAAVGEGDRDHVGRRAPADRRADPVQRRPLGTHRVPEDAWRARSRATASPSTRCNPVCHDTDRIRQLYGGELDPPRRRASPRACSDDPRTSGGSRRSCAPRPRRSSPAPPSRSTAGRTRGCF